jgi:hypothetical protein
MTGSRNSLGLRAKRRGLSEICLRRLGLNNPQTAVCGVRKVFNGAYCALDLTNPRTAGRGIPYFLCKALQIDFVI